MALLIAQLTKPKGFIKLPNDIKLFQWVTIKLTMQ